MGKTYRITVDRSVLYLLQLPQLLQAAARMRATLWGKAGSVACVRFIQFLRATRKNLFIVSLCYLLRTVPVPVPVSGPVPVPVSTPASIAAPAPVPFPPFLGSCICCAYNLIPASFPFPLIPYPFTFASTALPLFASQPLSTLLLPSQDLFLVFKSWNLEICRAHSVLLLPALCCVISTFFPQ